MSSPFGRALLRYWGSAGHVLASFRAKDWYAQLRELTDPKKGGAKGWEALQETLSIKSTKTLEKWLSDHEYPIRKSYREQIQRAYDLRRGAGWNPANEQHKYRISGEVKTGRDSRDRGAGNNAPLLIEGTRGNWSRIRAGYEDGSLTEELAEEWFIEDVLIEDIGAGSDGWEFPGSSYSIA